MKVMLIKDVENVGRAGDIKEVADGFGRNFLLPRKLAVVARASAEAEAKRLREAAAKREARSREDAQLLADEIGDRTVVVRLRVGADDKAFGSITNQDVADAPVFAAIKGEVQRALDADALIAHNAHVDLGVLQRKLGDWRPPEVFDTLKLARRLLPNAGSYKLGSLVDAFKLPEGLPNGLTPHRATYDVLVTARLFVQLATLPDTGPLSVEELRGDPPGGGQDEAPALF